MNGTFKNPNYIDCSFTISHGFFYYQPPPLRLPPPKYPMWSLDVSFHGRNHQKIDHQRSPQGEPHGQVIGSCHHPFLRLEEKQDRSTSRTKLLLHWYLSRSNEKTYKGHQRLFSGEVFQNDHKSSWCISNTSPLKKERKNGRWKEAIAFWWLQTRWN